jgi:hypothetical protein
MVYGVNPKISIDIDCDCVTELLKLLVSYRFHDVPSAIGTTTTTTTRKKNSMVRRVQHAALRFLLTHALDGIQDRMEEISFSLVSDELEIGTATLKAILGPDAKVSSIFEFVTTYFSTVRFKLDVSQPDHRELDKILVVPSGSVKLVPGCKIDAACRQSLSSLVDDAVWILLQRRERLKGSQQDGRNLLCQGYKIPNYFGDSASDRCCPNMPAAVTMSQINDNVGFWKSRPMFQLLHKMVGDEVMRTILLNTSVFVPMVQDGEDEPDGGIRRGNYMQISGPSCRACVIDPSSSAASSSAVGKGKRKRPIPDNHLDSKNLLPGAQVPKKGLFYSSTFVPKVSLPTNHILNGPCDPEALLKSMLLGSSIDLKHSRRRRKRWKGLCHDGLFLCERLFKKHRSCDYHRLLDRFCPLPQGLDRSTEVSLPEAAAAHSSVDGVIAFLSGVLNHVLPTELLGSTHNLDQLLQHVASFVRLRRQEFLANKSILNGMRVTHASWLFAADKGANVHRTDHHAAQLLFLRMLRWIFGQLVVPLIASVFHVTESEMSGKQVLYYRKPVWSIFRSLSMKKLLKDQYVEISADEAIKRLSTQQMGFSRLRLVPKETGVRPIATLCKQEPIRLDKCRPSAAVTDYETDDDEIETPFFKARKKRKLDASLVGQRLSVQSTNQILSNLFSVLQYETARQMELFGAGVDGLHYFYPRYREFLGRLRSKCPAHTPVVYFVSVDIQHAYDSIDQKYLLSVVDKIITQRDYCVQRYDVFHPFASASRVIKRPRRRVGPTESIDSLHNYMHDDFRRSVFVDSVDASVAGKTQLLKQLTEHLTSHLVTIRGRYGDRFLVQSTGIPQGSVLSTMLCNFYYGAVEKRLLSELNPDATLNQTDDATMLIRMVDDFMLATTNYSLASSFLESMEAGDESLGVKVNASKTKVSAPMTLDGRVVDPGPESSGGYFPWCGMLFDLKTGAVRIDYTRLVNTDVGSSLTVERGSHEGLRFSAALKTFVRPRCIPILFDSFIDDTRNQAINFFQLQTFCAAKTVAYLRTSDMMATLETNLTFVVRALDSTIRYGLNLIKDRLAQVESGLELGFSRQIGFWIAWTAFYEVFRRNTEFVGLADVARSKTSNLQVHDSFRHATAEAIKSPGIVDLLTGQ